VQYNFRGDGISLEPANVTFHRFEEHRQYRFFPLPPHYNFRRASLWSFFGPAKPLVLQSHSILHARTNETNLRAVLTSIALATHRIVGADTDTGGHAVLETGQD
jgi:hypothetical protein